MYSLDVKAVLIVSQANHKSEENENNININLSRTKHQSNQLLMMEYSEEKEI